MSPQESQHPSDPGPGAPLLNVARGIAMIGADDALRSILSSVWASLPQDSADIRKLLQSGDVHRANRLLHAIKGYAPLFCADALTAEVVQIEALSRTAAPAEVAPVFEALDLRLKQLLAEIQAFLSTPAA